MKLPGILAGVVLAAAAGTAVTRPALRAQSSSSPEMNVVLAAADALGGRDRISAIKSLRIEGNGQQAAFEGGENITADLDAPMRWLNVIGYARTIDISNARSRVEQRTVTNFGFARAAQYGRFRQRQMVDRLIAYDVAEDGKTTRLSGDVARTRRMEMRSNPIMIVLAAMQPTSKLSGLKAADDVETIDLTFMQGDQMRLAVNKTTHLPAWVSWVGYSENFGDVTYRTEFFGYDAWDGVMMPAGYTTKWDVRNTTLQTLRVDRNAIDVAVDDLATPETVRAAPVPVPAAPSFKAVEVARGVWHMAPASHQSVIFEFADHLTMFEPGGSNAYVKAVIDMARTLSPKPLTDVILSHYHYDHTRGIRAAVAAGLTIIAPRGTESILQEMVSRPSKSPSDPQGLTPKPLKLKVVDGELTLKDSAFEVRVLPVVDNSHMAQALAAYVPRDRLFIQADMYVDDWDYQWWGGSYMATVNKYKLQIDKDVPVHGPVVPFARIGPTIQKQFQNAQAFCNDALKAGFPIPDCPPKP